MGYRPETANGREPWRWHLEGPLDPDAQARAFQERVDVAREHCPSGYRVELIVAIKIWKHRK